MRMQVVVLITFNNQLNWMLQIIKEVVDEMGEDYSSYTFISSIMGTQVQLR